MSQGNTNIKPRTCYKCRYEANIDQTTCPNCGGRMKTRGQIRFLGFILTALSSFIVVFMGAITVSIYQMSLAAGTPGTSARFTGTKDQLMMIYALFALVILFGCIGLVTGLWQLIFGRRNRILVYSVLGLGAILYIVAMLFYFGTKN